MAEAYISRRGAVVRSGVVSLSTNSTSLTIPDLVGARDALITACATDNMASTPSYVASVIIENGAVVAASYVSKGGNGSGMLTKIDVGGSITFDTTSGTVSLNSSLGAKFVSTDYYQHYHYVGY